jgi:hypothetical protein
MTLNSIAKQRSARQPTTHQRWTPARVFRLSELWKSGLTMEFIAEQMGLTRETTRQAICKYRAQTPYLFPYRDAHLLHGVAARKLKGGST